MTVRRRNAARAEALLGHVAGWNGRYESRWRPAARPTRIPDDAFRGLYLADETVDALLVTGREPYQGWSAFAGESAADTGTRCR